MKKPEGVRLIDPVHLENILHSIPSERLVMAVSMYYNLVDQDLSSDEIVVRDDWSFKAMEIEPIVRTSETDMIVGAVILVGFLSGFQTDYLPSFQVVTMNRFTNENPSSFIVEGRQGIYIDLVRDEDLSTFKLLQRKAADIFKNHLSSIWEKVIKTISMTVSNGSDQKPRAQVRHPASIPKHSLDEDEEMDAGMPSMPVINAMPPVTHVKPAAFPVNPGFNVPIIGGRLPKPVLRLKPPPVRTKPPDDDIDDDLSIGDDDIDIHLANRIPDIDEDPPSFSPEMMKKSS